MVDETTPLVDIVPDDKNLTPDEVAKLKWIIRTFNEKGGPGNDEQSSSSSGSVDSDYPEFAETTHAWAVYGSSKMIDRLIGIMIILFQLYVYVLFATEAYGDYLQGTVNVLIPHKDCSESFETISLEHELICAAEQTSYFDAFAAFFMLGIFLTSDIIQAFRALVLAWGHHPLSTVYALFAVAEVVTALFAATIAISQKLYVGEVTDAIEVGVGLLFIRELSEKAYAGLRYNKEKKYVAFFSILTITVLGGFFTYPLLEKGLVD